MMPRLPSTVVRETAIAVSLLIVIVLSLALPARHVLLPAWPERVEEWLIESTPGRIDRRFVPAGQNAAPPPELLTSSRPITLWRIEQEDGAVSHAWLAGVRDPEGVLLPGLPPWLEGVRLDGPLPGPVELVVIDAGRETRDIGGDAIRRMYRPNGLSHVQRAELWRDRLDERWDWPFSPTSDARMTPPRRSTNAPTPP
jgi:hypothetical protein